MRAGQISINTGLGRQERHHRTHLLRVALQIDTKHLSSPSRGPNGRRRNAQQRAFSAAVVPNHGEDLAWGDRDRDTANGPAPTVTMRDIAQAYGFRIR